MAWIPASGAYFPETWYPSLAGAWLVLLVTALAGGRLLPATRSARVALGAFGALVAFNYLSMLWAGSPADALTASNQLLLYLVVAWTFSILPWTAASVAGLLGAWSLGVAIFCGVDLVRVTGASSLAQFFSDYRYATPLAYPNATAALGVMGMWPALILSSRRELSPWLRGPLLGLAMFLIEFSFLPESRGALVGLLVSGALVLVFASDRIVLLVRLAVLGIGLAVSLPTILDVTQTVDQIRPVGPVLAHSAHLLLITSLVAVSVGMCLPLVEASLESKWIGRGVRASRRRFTRLTSVRSSRQRLVTWSVVVVVGVGIAGALAAPAINRLASQVAHQGQTDAQTGTSRLLSTAPEERLDYARVALRLFADSPLGGVGAGNFGRRYDALRRFPSHSQYTHNLPLRVLSETGIVGFGLLIALVAALLIGLGRGALELPGLGRAAIASALAISAFFAVHASFDWLDEFPVLAAPALAFPLAAIGMRRAPAGPIRSRRRLFPAFRVGALVAATALIALAAVPPYVELRYTDRALTVYSHQPSTAYHDLQLAADANPLSANPLLTEGTLAVRQGDWALARTAFTRADRREDLWFAHLELALLDARSGQFALASGELNRAAALDAHDPVIAQARELVRDHKRIDPSRFNRLLLQGPEAAIYGREQIR